MIARTLIASLAVTLALAGVARAEDAEAALDPAKEAQVRDTLTQQGYEVRSVGMEDGRIEVYAIKDGAMVEIYLADDLSIAEVKQED
jgi:hypothetical protein